MFSHPSYAGYYLEYILPIVLALLIVARRNRDRLLFAALFGFGLLAMYFTFARAPVVGLFCGCVLVIGISGWSGLISRRAFRRCVFIFAVFMALIMPLVIKYMDTRLQTLTRREELVQMALQTIWKRPIMGAGLNNSSVASPAKSIDSTGRGTRELNVTVVHNHYLIVLVEVGTIGFVLFFAFFGRTVVIGLRHVRAAEMERKLLLVGMIGGLASVAVHNLGDPFGTHMVWAMLWLYAALIIAISRQLDLASTALGHGAQVPQGLRPGVSVGRPAGPTLPASIPE
jgi:O-antigen ligase